MYWKLLSVITMELNIFYHIGQKPFSLLNYILINRICLNHKNEKYQKKLLLQCLKIVKILQFSIISSTSNYCLAIWRHFWGITRCIAFSSLVFYWVNLSFLFDWETWKICLKHSADALKKMQIFSCFFCSYFFWNVHQANICFSFSVVAVVDVVVGGGDVDDVHSEHISNIYILKLSVWLFWE